MVHATKLPTKRFEQNNVSKLCLLMSQKVFELLIKLNHLFFPQFQKYMQETRNIFYHFKYYLSRVWNIYYCTLNPKSPSLQKLFNIKLYILSNQVDVNKNISCLHYIISFKSRKTYF